MVDKQKNPVYVMYIGSGLYDPAKFEEEAKALGVSRAIPPTWLNKLKEGDRIYTLFKRNKYSLMTGYFVLDGYSFGGPDAQKLREYMWSHKEEVGAMACSDGTKQPIERQCGHYVDGGGCTVSDIRKAAVKLYEVAKENGWKVKFFARGKYYPLPKKKRLSLPFTRGIAEYYLDVDADTEEVEEGHIDVFEDYIQVRYQTKTKRKRKTKNKS